MLGKKKKIVQSHRCMEAGMCEIKEQEQFNVAKMRKFGKTREWQNIKLRGRLKLDQEFEFYFIGNAKLLNLGKESTHKDYREDSFSPSERVACRLERWIGEWKRVSLVVQCLVAQSCLTLCHPVDCSLPGSSPWGFSRQEYWSGLPCPPPGDLPNLGIEPRSPMLEADSLPSEPLGDQPGQLRVWDGFMRNSQGVWRSLSGENRGLKKREEAERNQSFRFEQLFLIDNG